MNKDHDLYLIKLLSCLIRQDKLLRFAGTIDPTREGWYMCEYPRDTKGFFRWFDETWLIEKDRWCPPEKSIVLDTVFGVTDIPAGGHIDSSTVLVPIGRPLWWHGIKK